MRFARTYGTVAAVAVVLTLFFWGPLWFGYGFVGGDLYPYFFPQKAFLSDRLHAGEFPLWNNLTGFGYPVLGESQTGAAYPPHVVAYYLFDVNTAYNVEHLLHYVLCFVATWLFARRVGLEASGAVLTALVFTYGWFPPRACLEWAIVTGAWLPFALWCVESFVQTRWWRYAIGLSIVLGLQLLAGHFHLAFITQLLVVAYGAWRVMGRRQEAGDRKQELGEDSKHVGLNVRSCLHSVSCLLSPVSLSLLCSLTAGFLLAAVQLLPAWELKTRSSRAVVGGEHDPAYGHLPPLYVSQMIAPFLWYSPLAIEGEEAIRTVSELAAPWHWFGPHHDLEAAVQQTKFGALGTATNKIEAHLYCGLVPLGLAVWWLMKKTRGRELRDERLFWLIAGLIALVYATGWLLPVARFIPGFNFFRGPGRYGIMTTFAVALLAGRGVDALLAQRGLIGRRVLIGLVFWSTCGDLWLVSRMVTNVVMVSQPAISFREQSAVRRLLLDEPSLPRLYCPGQNVGNLLGVSCLPVYLGIAPREYADPKFAGAGMPKPTEDGRPVAADNEFSKWLRASGVTHILSFHPLDEATWQATLVWSGFDEMLNRAWGRGEPHYLYRLANSSGLAWLVFNKGNSQVTVPQQRLANEFFVETKVDHSASLMVAQLHYPGWFVRADDGPESATRGDGLHRNWSASQTNRRITWTYRPRSVTIGAVISLATLIVLAALGHLRFWHREWLDRMVFQASVRRQPDGSGLSEKTPSG